MNVYIWEYTSPLSTSYHDGGSAVIVAESVSAARDMWLHSIDAQEIRDHGVSPDNSLAADPDHVIPTDEAEEAKLLLFLDTGCC